jgi:hypothetical protein
MTSAALALWMALIVPAALPADRGQEVRFTGLSAVDELCASLLELRRDAEAQGRLDFTAEVASVGAGDALALTARIWPGSAYGVGRINFAGHSSLDDATIRRAMTISERGLLDVGQLRRSLARINDLGVFDPLTLADVAIARQPDGVTADLTISLRERKRRWWSVSGPLFPGLGTVRASLSARLPPWGRGVLEASTYFISLNVAGIAKPFLALQRPLVPGQELFSGFAISPALSPEEMLMHYGRSHLTPRIGALLEGRRIDPLSVPVTSAAAPAGEPIVCVPPTPRLRWLRRGAAVAANVALEALIF